MEQLSSGKRALTNVDLYHDAPKCHQKRFLIERINTYPIKTTAKPTPSSRRGRTKQEIEREVLTEQHHGPVRPSSYPWGTEALKTKAHCVSRDITQVVS